MNKIWEFFENLDEFVYVSDMDSYEVIYMNQKTLKKYGLNSHADYKGKKCYELLQGCHAPCAICNNNELTPGYFKEWQYFNPVIKKRLMLKDTVIKDGEKRYRIEIAMDMSVQELQSNIIRNYQDLEAIVNDGIQLAMQAATPDKSIDVILEYLGKALNGERTYIFEQNKAGGDDNTYEWVATGVTPEKDNLQDLPPEVCANWYRNFSENKSILIETLEDIREEDPLQYENLKRQNINSIAVVPLYDDKKAIGFYGVDNPPKQNLEYASNILQIMGYFIVSTLKRRNLLKQLQEMSYFDRLTQIGNRYAMEEYLTGI
ncbi:MAG: GAF domain-containing protein, partial [Oscillospiraceae bacterium]